MGRSQNYCPIAIALSALSLTNESLHLCQLQFSNKSFVHFSFQYKGNLKAGPFIFNNNDDINNRLFTFNLQICIQLSRVCVHCLKFRKSHEKENKMNRIVMSN